MKGVRATKPRLEVAQNVLKALVRHTEHRPDVSITCAFEYMPITKICSVPSNATACIRIPHYNVVSVVRWKENTEENLKFARAASREITDTVVKGNVELTDAENTAYGNYGALFF
jgi:hypothetical protein